MAFYQKTLNALVKDSKVLEREEILDLLTVSNFVDPDLTEPEIVRTDAPEPEVIHKEEPEPETNRTDL